VSDAVMQEVRQQSGGHPFLTQYLMHELWDYGINQVTPEIVRKLAAKFTHERNDFCDWADRLGSSAHRVYRVFVDLGQDISEKQLREALQPVPSDLLQVLDALWHHGLIVCDPDHVKYRIAGEMFRDWFVSNILATQISSVVQHGDNAGAVRSPIMINVTDGDVVIGGKPVQVDLRGQQVHGPQTNVAGDIAGNLLSGDFHGSVLVQPRVDESAS
jgi:hypothetical protein